VRAGYQRVAGLDAALRCVEELSARTAIFDLEPLVAYWDSGQEALERGVALLVTRTCPLPEVQVVCFATNSMRRPRASFKRQIGAWTGAELVLTWATQPGHLPAETTRNSTSFTIFDGTSEIQRVIIGRAIYRA
jgi:hypothetical protein